MKSEMTYSEVVRCASFKIDSYNAARSRGAYVEADIIKTELAGMAKIIATMFNLWEETCEGQSAQRVMDDIIKAKAIRDEQ